jgi:hypothetical protein
MKARLVVAGIILGLALGVGCKVAGDDSPLLLGNFHRFKEDCTPVTDVVAGGGSLDVSATTTYYIAADVHSQTSGVVQPGSQPGTDVVQGAPSEIIIDTIDLDYTSADLGATIANETSPIHFVISPGSTGNWMGLNLFPGMADDTLESTVVFGQEATVEVGVRVSGRTRSGGSVSSNRAVFPITVYNAGFPGCTYPEQQAHTGPCDSVGGQDGTAVGCCPVTDAGVNLNCLDTTK